MEILIFPHKLMTLKKTQLKGYGSQGEFTCKNYLGLKGFNSDLPIKFITIPNCKQREVKNFGEGKQC